MKKTLYQITENEEDEIGRLMLSAAFAAFGEHYDYASRVNREELARRVVKALISADAARKKEVERLKVVYKGNILANCYIDASDVVASAFSAWHDRCDDAGLIGVSPQSAGGAMLMGFAQGIAASAAMMWAFDLLEDEEVFTLSAKGAARLAAKE